MNPRPITRKTPVLWTQETYLNCLMQIWCLHVGAREKMKAWQSRQGVEAWRRYLREQSVFFADATTSDFDEFKADLRSKRVAYDSQVTWLKGVSQFYGWLVSVGYQGQNPIQKSKPRALPWYRSEKVRNPFAQDQGQGLVEYALILVLVAVVVIVILALFGSALGNLFSTIVRSL